MTILESARLRALPPYPFAALDAAREAARARGADIIDLGVGDPDLPTPPHVVQALKDAVDDPANHRYPSYVGLPAFRAAAAGFLAKRFGVVVDPASQVVSLIGSKEGIAHFPLAFVDPGDVVLVPDPGYPVYHIGTLFAGGETYRMPLTRANAFLPDLGSIPRDVARRAKMIFLNYPNNPTAATATEKFFADVLAFATDHDLIVAHDQAYSEMAYDGYRPPSFLATPGAMERSIEFHSLSKTYNMTGWRIGFAAGNEGLVRGLGRVKTNVDSGVFQAVQAAAIRALTADQACVAAHVAVWRERRDVAVAALRAMGIDVPAPRATFYVWFPVPAGATSAGFCRAVLEATGVVLTPGTAFGEHGEGYARIALTVPVPRLREAMDRLGRWLGR
jgi:LL-diaminopimelate aminotransferase